METNTEHPNFVYDESSGIYVAKSVLKLDRFEQFKRLAYQDSNLDINSDLNINSLPDRKDRPSQQELEALLQTVTVTPGFQGHTPRFITLDEYQRFDNWCDENGETFGPTDKHELVYNSRGKLLICFLGKPISDYTPSTDSPYAIRIREVLQGE